MNKIELVLEEATNEDIKRIEDYCEHNHIGFEFQDRHFYKNGQLIRGKGDKVLSSYYFYIMSTMDGFKELNTYMKDRLKIVGNTNNILGDSLTNCLDLMKQTIECEKNASEAFEKLIRSITDPDILHALYQYSYLMSKNQILLLEDRIEDLFKETGGTPEELKNYDIRTLRERTGMNRKEFCDYFSIPYRTVEDWESGNSKCAPYLYNALKMILQTDNKFHK